MNYWKWVALTFLVLCTLAHAPKHATPVPQETPDEKAPSASTRLTEQIFGFTVLLEILKRSVEYVRFVDTLLGILVTGQFTIYAIVIEKKDFATTLLYLDWALGIAAIGILITLVFIREVPRARTFGAALDLSPTATREDLIPVIIRYTERNEMWRAIKVTIFMISLSITILGLLAANHPIGVK